MVIMVGFFPFGQGKAWKTFALILAMFFWFSDANGQIIPFELNKVDSTGYEMAWKDMSSFYDGYIVWALPEGRPPYKFAIVMSSDVKGLGENWYQLRGKLGPGCHVFRIGAYHNRDYEQLEKVKSPPDALSPLKGICIVGKKEQV